MYNVFLTFTVPDLGTYCDYKLKLGNYMLRLEFISDTQANIIGC